MKWGTFSLSQVPDQSRRVAAMDEDMHLFELAERLGYDTIWLAEHLFSTYGMVTSTQVLAAAVARRTSTIAIGSAISVIPFNHPLRTASDFALVDVMSHGRLKFGVGRAYQPHEFVGLDVPMDKSREMYLEGMDLIIKAWTNDKITFDGQFWKVREETELLPKPVQKPHPPIYQATISPESFDVAAEKGWHIQLATPFTYRIYREEWKNALESSIKGFEKTCAQHGRDPKALERMMLIPFFCAEDGAQAKEIYGKHVEWFYHKVSSHQNVTSDPNKLIKGYELGMREGKKTREMGYLNFEKLHELGAAIAADPAQCIDQLQEFKDRLGITEFVLWSNVGGIPAEHAAASMRLAMEKVIPNV